MVSAIILSAGLSSRFGSPKALAKINGETVIAYIQKTLLATPINNIIVVLGAEHETIQTHILKHKRIQVVYNKDYKFGQTSSFKAGIKELSEDARGVFLFPIDCPFVKSETIAQLMDYFLDHQPKVLIPTYQGRKGHPPIFHSDLKDEFCSLDNDVGINTMAQKHKQDTVIFPIDDPNILRSFNTQEEFEQFKNEL